LFGIVFNDGESVFLDLCFETIASVHHHRHLVINNGGDEIDLPIENDYDRIPVFGSCRNYLSEDESILYFLWSADPLTGDLRETGFVTQGYSTKTWQREVSWIVTVPYQRKDLHVELLKPLPSDCAPKICITRDWNSITIRSLDQLETLAYQPVILPIKRS